MVTKKYSTHRVNPILQTFILSSILILFEVIFSYLCLFTFDIYSFIHIVLFSIHTSIIISLMCIFLKPIQNFIITSVVIAVIIIYGVSQVGMLYYLGTFFTFNSVVNMGGNVAEFADDFINFLKPEFLLLILPLLFYFLTFRILLKFKGNNTNFKLASLMIIMSLFLGYFSYYALDFWTSDTTFIASSALYKQPVYSERAIKEFGVLRFSIIDIVYSTSESNLGLIDVKELTYDKSKKYYLDQSLSRNINSDKWINLMNNEKSENVELIDRKLFERYISPKNNYTGAFRDKNLIFILVESFDYIALDPVLTPNLSKLVENGWLFKNYFTPKSICSTGDSELMSLTSLFASQTECTYNNKINNFDGTLFNIFSDNGYFTSSFHNFWDKYYDRGVMHPRLGSSIYMDANDLGIRYDKGWPSDTELIEKSKFKFIDEEKFFTFLITVSMHTPYDIAEGYIKENIEVVEKRFPNAIENYKVYLAKAMETDKAIGNLMEELTSKGKMDDTVIVLYSDHTPPKFDQDTLTMFTDEVDRNDGNNQFLSPLIMYFEGIAPQKISNLGSTVDLLPTLANLFDFDFDPRFYLGTDIFDESTNHFVYFQNGDWITEYGSYDNADSRYLKNTNSESLSREEISKINLRLIHFHNLSNLIYSENYFKYRDTSSITYNQK